MHPYARIVDGSFGRAWIAAMPATVARQRRMLTGLLDVVEAEPAYRWFELGCSLARGAGDDLSDVDCAVGVDEQRWDDARALGRRAADSLGPVADRMQQTFTGRGPEPCWHQFTLYQDGSQLSLVLMPASWRPGLPPGSVALYDPDGRLARPWLPDSASADADTVREWAALGWIALGDLAKYLDRGSLWEARQRLEEARAQLWRLWAVGQGLRYPQYGLTGLLDEPAPRLPPGVERSVAALDPAELRGAASATAGLLQVAIVAAGRVIAFDPPDGLRRWVLGRLTLVAEGPHG
jgi:hypothetical protein